MMQQTKKKIPTFSYVICHLNIFICVGLQRADKELSENIIFMIFHAKLIE